MASPESESSTLRAEIERNNTNALPELADPERAALIKQLSINLDLDQIGPGAYACLWLSNMERLQDIVRKAAEDPAAWSRVLITSDTTATLKAWMGRVRSTTKQSKERKNNATSSPSEADNTTALDSTPRSETAKKLCRERGNDTCLITQAGVPIEIAHIFPYSLGQREHVSDLRSVWITARLFWSKTEVKEWEQAILRSDGTETCSNLMALWSSVQGLWGRACFALRPLGMSSDLKALRVQFYWLSPRSYVNQVPITTPPTKPPILDHGPCNTRLWNCVTKEQFICSGDVLTFITKDPIKLPLPSIDFLRMQWALTQALAIRGAGEATDEDLYPDDYVEEEEDEEEVMTADPVSTEGISRIGENRPLRQMHSFIEGKKVEETDLALRSHTSIR